MKAEDLMIRNLVLCRGAISIVTSINANSISYITSKGKSERNIPLKLVKPIPLTEEWLVKFGFDKKINYEDFDYWGNSVFGYDFLWEHSKGYCYNFEKGYYMKHVHQLQNLYFALTGDELLILNETK